MYVQELLHNQTLTQTRVQVNLSLRHVTQNRDKEYENGNVYCLSVKLDNVQINFKLVWDCHQSLRKGREAFEHDLDRGCCFNK